MNSCDCVTSKGKKCKRKKQEKSDYCWQHSGEGRCKKKYGNVKHPKRKNDKKNQFQGKQKPEINMNTDTLKKILIESNYTVVKNMCLINKAMVMLCNDLAFWKEKFNYDGIPFIFNGNKITPQNKPENLVGWLKLYINVHSVKKVMTKLTKNMVNPKIGLPSIYLEFYVDVGPKTIKNIEKKILRSLPAKFNSEYNKIGIKKIGSKKSNLENFELEFKTKKGKFYIIVSVTKSDKPIEPYDISFKVSETQFIWYLTKLLYTFPDTDITDQDDRRFSYKQLSQQKVSKHVKFFLPEWYK